MTGEPVLTARSSVMVLTAELVDVDVGIDNPFDSVCVELDKSELQSVYIFNQVPEGIEREARTSLLQPFFIGLQNLRHAAIRQPLVVRCFGVKIAIANVEVAAFFHDGTDQLLRAVQTKGSVQTFAHVLDVRWHLAEQAHGLYFIVVEVSS